jgi:hypothetical protein
MLRKSFVFVMLLAASLIGIGSVANHQTEVAVTQPQPPQSPQQGQLQSPNTAASPSLGKRLPTGPQGLQQQQSDVGKSAQMLEDKALVDRLFPHIMQKMNGRILAQEIDNYFMSMLLLKMEAYFMKVLAGKVLPYLDNKITVTYRPGERNVQRSDWMDLKAVCLPDEIAVSGAFNGYKNNLAKYKSNQAINPNEWQFTFYGGGANPTYTGVNCLKAELGLLSEPRPPTPPPPSQPPGGAPLQPPPNLR